MLAVKVEKSVHTCSISSSYWWLRLETLQRQQLMKQARNLRENLFLLTWRRRRRGQKTLLNPSRWEYWKEEYRVHHYLKTKKQMEHLNMIKVANVTTLLHLRVLTEKIMRKIQMRRKLSKAKNMKWNSRKKKQNGQLWLVPSIRNSHQMAKMHTDTTLIRAKTIQMQVIRNGKHLKENFHIW